MTSLTNILLNELMSDTKLNAIQLKTTQTKPIADAVVNRNPISFMYYGIKNGKDSVKQGKRMNVEPVAIGMSKKGKLLLRAYVPSPNVSKKGFEKTNWRTFQMSNMRNITIDTNTVFNERPGYHPGDESKKGPMASILVSTDFNAVPKPKKELKPKAAKVNVAKEKPITPAIEPKAQPTEPTAVEPTTTVEPTTPETLPQPKPKQKPDVIPPTAKTLAQPKPEEPTQEPTAEPEVQPIEPEVNPEEENKKLQESINRIKTLILF
jgi:hypothetical protein